MITPRLLDLFCGLGGAGMGYHRAGFEVVGIDHVPQPHYPFTFERDDALDFVAEAGAAFDVIHASPPCPAYSSAGLTETRRRHPELINVTRELLLDTGRPYVIENVVGARDHLRDPILLCGSMFGLVGGDERHGLLQLRRHRLFEAGGGATIAAPGPCRHYSGVRVGGVNGNIHHGDTPSERRHGGEIRPARGTRARLLGIEWPATTTELNNAIPPAYTHHLGAMIMRSLIEAAS